MQGISYDSKYVNVWSWTSIPQERDCSKCERLLEVANRTKWNKISNTVAQNSIICRMIS